MTKIEISTREKILKVATKLFADKGLNGVGIRELAKESDVNVAAINYHFGHKESLYRETVKTSLSKTATDIAGLYSDQCSIFELSDRMYDYFVENKDDLLTGFKLFLSSDAHSERFNEEDEMIGPPGGHVMYSCIQQEYPSVSEEDLVWAVRTLFTQIIHKAVLICNHSDNIQERFNLESKDFKNDIQRLVKIVINEIKQSA